MTAEAFVKTFRLAFIADIKLKMPPIISLAPLE